MKRLITILIVLISIVSISFASTDTTTKTENITILDFAGNNKELLETQAIAHQMAGKEPDENQGLRENR